MKEAERKNISRANDILLLRRLRNQDIRRLKIFQNLLGQISSAVKNIYIIRIISVQNKISIFRSYGTLNSCCDQKIL